MAQRPIITQVLIVPGLNPNRQIEDVALPNNLPPQTHLSVGIVTNTQHVAWGFIGNTSDASADSTPDYRRTLEQTVIPALIGQSLAEFKPLATQIAQLTETVTETHLQQPAPQPQPARISRRALLTGHLRRENTPQSEPTYRQDLVTRPIDPAMRYGVSQAILAAVAQSQTLTPSQVIAAEYALPTPITNIPFHLTVDPVALPDTNYPPLKNIASIGYSVAGSNPQTELGNNTNHLQRHVRQLKQWLQQSAAHQPAIYLNLRGTLGHLFNNNAGEILGSLYGLEQAAKPYSLIVQDSVLIPHPHDLLAWLAQLKEYLRFRKMSTQLSVGITNHTPDIAQLFIEAQISPWFYVDMAQSRSLHNTIEVVQMIKAAGFKVMLANTLIADESAGQWLAQVGLGTHPNCVAASWHSTDYPAAAQVSNEIERTLARIKLRQIDE